MPDGRGTTIRTIRAVENRETVCIFPEGDIHPTFTTGRIHSGALVVAHKTQVPIVPARIAGTDRIWPVTFWPLKPWRLFTCRITIGPPLEPLPEHKNYSRFSYRRKAKKLMDHIRSL